MNNIFFIIGRIYKDFELKTTSTNKSLVELPIAINNGKDDTTFLKVLLFNATAETTAKYCKKGDLVGVQGMIKNNNWVDDKDNKHYDYTFLANKITFLSTTKSEEKEEKEEDRDLYEEYGKEAQVSIDDNFLD